MSLRSYTLNSSTFTNSRNQNSDPRSHPNSVCQVNHWHVSVSSSHSPWQQPPRHPNGATLLYPQVAVGVPGQLHFSKAVGLHLPPSVLHAGCGAPGRKNGGAMFGRHSPAWQRLGPQQPPVGPEVETGQLAEGRRRLVNVTKGWVGGVANR